MSDDLTFEGETSFTYIGPISKQNYEQHGTVISALLVEIEKKARIHGMVDVLLELDKMSVVDTPDWFEVAGVRLVAISQLVEKNLKAMEKNV